MTDKTKEGWKEVSLQSDSIWDRKKPIEGLLIDKRENVGPNDSKFYTIEKSGGERVGIWGSTVLDTKLKDIKIGEEEVYIECLGEVKSEKTGRTYTDYQVFKRKVSQELKNVAEEVFEEGE